MKNRNEADKQSDMLGHEAQVVSRAPLSHQISGLCPVIKLNELRAVGTFNPVYFMKNVDFNSEINLEAGRAGFWELLSFLNFSDAGQSTAFWAYCALNGYNMH